MSAMASAQGYSLTNKVWQVCTGWLMEAKRQRLAGHSTQTLVDIDFR
jgi:hypothetical protein